MGRQIEKEYIDTGKVRFGYLHLVILGQESQWSAEASECAAEQDAFWPYHDRLFENQAAKNSGGFSQENLLMFAGDLELDVPAFKACQESGKYTGLIKQETQLGFEIGFRGTPAFLINGRALVGDQPFEKFQEIIEAELERLESK